MKFERNKMEEVIAWIGSMAEGRDPVTGEALNSEALDNPNVIRCLHYVQSVLKDIAGWGAFVEMNSAGILEMSAGGNLELNRSAGTERNSGTKKKGPKKEFPFEILSEFRYSNDKSISFVLKQFAEPAAEENIKRPSPAAVNKWLERNGYIEKRIIRESGRECWFPCRKGTDIGLYTSEHGDPAYRYATVMYSREAQQFLAENLETIIRESNAPRETQTPFSQSGPE